MGRILWVVLEFACSFSTDSRILKPFFIIEKKKENLLISSRSFHFLYEFVYFFFFFFTEKSPVIFQKLGRFIAVETKRLEGERYHYLHMKKKIILHFVIKI